MVNLPNILTGVRFFGTPGLIYLYLCQNYFLAFWVMLFLGITDWLDGFCARKFKQESLFGKVFDPIADKTLMIGMFATLGYLKALPLAFVFLCLGRDILIALGGFAMMRTAYRKDLSPTKASKINTFLQILCILVVTYRLHAPSISPHVLFSESVLLGLTSLFTIASGMQYAKTFWRFLKNT
ncbi:MAG: CDP-alcohol phosphatidyltransferase family protein [Proteobacteria bacterium]|nr:CDP-alcohol phosphatidyltransferase family protein [Pseudomonadota bacterium]